MCRANYTLLLLCIALLGACSSMPMITDEDVALHQQTGDWQAFYEQLKSELSLAKPDSELADNRTMYMDIIGRKIAEKKEQELFDGLGRGLSQHNIVDLNKALDQSSTLSIYSEAVAQDYRHQIEQAISQKQGVIANKQAEFAALNDEQAVKKMAILDEIILIYGPSAEADGVQTQKTTYFNGLVNKAQQALTDKDYVLCKQVLNNIEKINKDYPFLEELRNNLQIATIESHLWDALEAGQKEKAYSALQQLAESPGYIESHQETIAIAEDLAVYFEAEASASSEQKNYIQAYSSYSRAHAIRTLFALDESVSKDKTQFLKWVSVQLVRSIKANQHYQSYGLLLVLMELDPTNKLIEQYYADLNKSLLDEARLKIVAGHIENEKQLPIKINDILIQVGKVITDMPSARMKWIDNSLTDENTVSATKLISQPNAASYLTLGGTLQSAVITSSEHEMRTVKSVITGYNKIENPAYSVWNALTEQEKVLESKPKKYIQLPIEQNVELLGTRQDKDALIELNYWLTEVVDATAIMSKDVKKAKTFSAITQQPLEVGLFVQEAVSEALPNDDAVFQDMMLQSAEEIVKAVLDQAKLIQDQYVEKANAAVVTENFKEANQYFAYSYVLESHLGNEDSDTLYKLKLYSLKIN